MAKFSRDNRRPDGRVSKCMACKKEYARAYRAARPNLAVERYWNNPAGERERHLVRKYGVSLKEYDRLFALQEGKCGICEKTQERAFDVDHDHKTGRVRGLLCTSCNRMLGHAGDNPGHLARGIAYLLP